MNEDIRLIKGDCIQVMQDLIKQGVKVDLTVTSPPYDNLRTYNDTCEWNFDIFKQVAKCLYDITADGGVVVWVVGDATINGSETGTSFRQALYFKEIGFNLLDTMIYLKQNYAPIYPSARRYANQFEYMFVLTKGKHNNFTPKQLPKVRNKEERVAYRQKDGSLRRKLKPIGRDTKDATNVWSYAVGGNKTGHPAVFPEQLANDHIISWSNEGDLVLDCFMGSGTTGKMSLLNNRRFIGIEKVDEYFGIAKKRINDAIANKQPNLF